MRQALEVLIEKSRQATSNHRIFSHAAAADIVAHPQLSQEMKLSLLRQWEQTARSLSVAESEGMGGGEDSKLGRVEQAIALVEKQP